MKKIIAAAALTLLGAGFSSAINIAPGGTVSESFSIGTIANATLPSDWKADKNTTARTVGTYSSAVTATEQRAGNSMSSSAANGIYNYGAGPADTATDRAVGGISSSSASKSVNVYTKLTNNGASTINSFTVSYSVEKYRNGSNAAGFGMQMYYSTDGSSWTSAGADFLCEWTADADNNGYASAPGATKTVSSKTLNVSLAAGNTLYLAWNYSVRTGTTTSNAQGLGLDDVSITAAGTSANDMTMAIVADSESATISSLINNETISTTSDGAQAWQVTFNNPSGGAGAGTITAVTLTPGDNNGVANWSTTILAAELFDGASALAAGTIAASSIAFSGLNVAVAEGGSKTLSLRISLKSTAGALTDKNIFQFLLSSGNVTVSGNGVTTPSISSDQTKNQIAVVATQIGFTSVPSFCTINQTFSATVNAQDTHGNTDLDSAFGVTITRASGSGILSGGASQTLSSGTKTFSSLAIDTAGAFTLQADGNSFTPVTSSSITATQPADYRSKQTGNWNATTTWESYNGSAWVDAVATPTSSDGVITIQSGHTVTVTVNVSVDQVVVSSGGQIIIISGITLTVANCSSTDLSVSGILKNSDGTITISTSATIVFTSTGKYQHNYTTAAGTIPAATWDSGSTCEIIGYTSNTSSPGGLNQSFHHFTWNCPNQSGNINASGILTIVNGNLTVTSTGSGSFRLSATSVSPALEIGGDLIVNGGSFDLVSGTALPIVTLSGSLTVSSGTLKVSSLSSTATINITGGASTFTAGGTLSGKINIVVKSGGVLSMGTAIMPGALSGTFTVESGAGLAIGDANGITGSDASGNIQVSGTRSFNTGANYTYNGSAAQVTGNGLPATVNNLTIDNTAGVTLSQNVSANGSVTMTAGILNVNGKTLSSAVTVQSGTTLRGSGTISGAVTVNSTGIVSPGNSIGTIATGDLTFEGGSIIEWEYDDTSADLIDAGTLVFGNPVTVKIIKLGTVVNGEYTLANFTGSDPTLGNLSFNLSGALGVTSVEPYITGTTTKSIKLVLLPEPGVCVLAGLLLIGARAGAKCKA